MGLGPVLFLDDNEERIEHIKKVLGDTYIRAVRTAAECIEALELDGPWHTVYLDHDLGGEVFVNSLEANTGMEVVRWLVREGINKVDIKQIVVHSWNLPAAAEMVSKLADVGFNAVASPFEIV
jgi:CheY-like chemotaxis protein